MDDKISALQILLAWRAIMNRARFPLLSVLIAVCLSAALPAWASAQELASVAGEWVPSSNIESPDSLGEVAPGADPSVNFSKFKATVNVPFRLTDHATLMPGAGYDFFSIRHSDDLLGFPTELQLHTVSAFVLFHYRFNSRWEFAVSFMSMLAGDFAEFGMNHFRPGGSALITYVFSKRFSLSVGLLASWQFGRPLLVPAIGWRWRIFKNLRIDGLLPAQAALVWQLHNRVEIGLSASIYGSLYALTSQQGEWPCAAQTVDDPATTTINESEPIPDRCFTDLAYSRGEIGPSLSVRLASSLWLSIHAGFLFYRRYEFMNDNGESPGIGNHDLAPNVTLQAQLELRIPRP
jgi:hypothetical protein